MKCGECKKTDGLVYTSYPPKVRCCLTGNFHFMNDECDAVNTIKHGHWEIDEKRYGNKDPHCSICRAILEGDADKCRNNYYCYHCGAKMDEVEE